MTTEAEEALARKLAAESHPGFDVDRAFHVGAPVQAVVPGAGPIYSPCTPAQPLWTFYLPLARLVSGYVQR